MTDILTTTCTFAFAGSDYALPLVILHFYALKKIVFRKAVSFRAFLLAVFASQISALTSLYLTHQYVQGRFSSQSLC